MKKILIITRFFPPEIGAAAERLRCFAKYLAENHKITVLTTMPSYPEFHTYKPYRWKLFSIENNEDNYRVVRYRTLNLGKSIIARFISDITFVVFGLFVSFFLGRKDKVIVSSPQLIFGFLALFWKFVRRTPYIFDVRDLNPDHMIEVGFITSRSTIRMLRYLEKLFYRHASTVTTVSLYLANKIRKRTKTPVRVVYNGIDLERFRKLYIHEEYNEQVKKYFVEGYKHGIYIGNLGRIYNFDVILEAAKKLEDEKIRFIIVGEGPLRERLEEKCSEEGINNVVFLGSQASHLMPSFIKYADFGIVSLIDSPLTLGSLAIKVFEYIAGGLPVISNVKGESQQVFNGALQHFSTPDDVVKQVMCLNGKKGKIKKEELLNRFDRKNTVKELNKLL